MELLVSHSTGEEGKSFTRMVIPESDLPKGWKTATTAESEAVLKATAYVPENTPLGVYNFRVKMQNVQGGYEEYFVARVSVEENLLGIKLLEPEQSAVVNKPVDFKLAVTSKSASKYRLAVESSLSESWFETTEINIEPNKTDEFILEANPKLSGLMPLVFYLSSDEVPSAYYELDATLHVKPTMKEKFGASLYGFPFFTVSLVPYSMINSFIAYVLP